MEMAQFAGNNAQLVKLIAAPSAQTQPMLALTQ